MKIVEFVPGNNPYAAMEQANGMAEVGQKTGRWRLVVRFTPTGAADALVVANGDVMPALMADTRPMVAIVSRFGRPNVPCVAPDDHHVGVLAADHFADLGLRRVAYIGIGRRFARERGQGFATQARQRGLTFDTRFDPCLQRPFEDVTNPEQLGSMMRGLEWPCGLFCMNDEVAEAAIDMAHALGLRVPEQVAVLGVDDFPLRCEFNAVTISSVNLNHREIGRQAGRIISRLLDGAHTDDTILVPPDGVQVRRSTEVIAISEPEIARALSLVRENACRGISVDDILKQVNVSRSWLDRRFKVWIGRTCSDELERVRLTRAQELLRETNIPLSEVASASGFNYLSHMSHAFRRSFGMSPSQYRRQQAMNAQDWVEADANEA